MKLDEAFSLLSRDPAAPLDLAEVALRIAQDEYPDLDVEAYLNELDSMAHEARAYMTGSLDKRLSGLCRYLFHDMGFHGNVQEYYDPRNSYVNEVLERRTGLPITLSIVAIAVGNRAGLEIQGVGLPGHFVAKAVSDGHAILFDPFHGGRLLTVTDCENLIHQVTGKDYPVGQKELKPTPTGTIIARTLTNLKGIYLKAEDYDRLIRVTQRLCQLAPNDPSQHRDLGAAFLQIGEAGKAINPLQTYLRVRPEGADVPDVRQLLSQAKSAVAKWN